MKLIAHRKNSIAELLATPEEFGVELDLRSSGNDIVIHHDPFSHGERFDAWLDHYRHGTLILNVKEEGLEPRLIRLMQERGIEDYFFLDQSFPFMLRHAEAARGRSAVRVSEYESIETALAVAGKVGWIWVDCFTRFPLATADAVLLRDSGFRLCLVSPELQGADAGLAVPAMASALREQRIEFDAVCTKRPDLWQQEFGT